MNLFRIGSRMRQPVYYYVQDTSGPMAVVYCRPLLHWRKP